MSKATIIRFTQQIAFGWDTITGISVYVIVSFIFKEPFYIWFFLWSGLCAYLPDADFTYFMLQSKDVKKWGHWRLGFHHPILFTPIVGTATWFISEYHFPDHAAFLTTLAVIGILGHFVHDSAKTGLHWFSPITKDWKISFDALRWLNIKITSQGLHILSQNEVIRRYQETAEKSAAGGVGNEFKSRIEPVTTAQVFSLAISFSGLILLYLNN